jgi:hypothetical protein
MGKGSNAQLCLMDEYTLLLMHTITDMSPFCRSFALFNETHL